jgi:hypothetical protein
MFLKLISIPAILLHLPAQRLMGVNRLKPTSYFTYRQGALCVLYGVHSQHRLFLYTALPHWLL